MLKNRFFAKVKSSQKKKRRRRGSRALHQDRGDGRVHEPADVRVPADDGRTVRAGPVEPARHGSIILGGVSVAGSCLAQGVSSNVCK